MNAKIYLYLLLVLTLIACQEEKSLTELTASPEDLHFDQLPTVWDEAIPLGNGMVGALVWQKGGKLRFSLDRADLWDLRPMDNLETPEWRYDWVYQQWKKNNYGPVQEKFDQPYNQSPAPSKIPGAALEFDIAALGPVASVHLYLDQAVCEVVWETGVKLQTFVHATEPAGWFRFEGMDAPPPYDLIPPAYNLPGESEAENPVTGQDLRRLEYPEGKLVRTESTQTYDQEGWGGFEYQVHVAGQQKGAALEGCWSISSAFPGWEETPAARTVVERNLEQGIVAAYASHRTWWDHFWSQSSVSVPDEVLQKQWRLEQYKFGSAARPDAPPISLQAVWTADNGKIPPWKGDFHHDLNTQLSYWPSYSGNHLEQEIGFLNWLWKNRDTFRQYTRGYFESEGLNVPGVSTLTGAPMGGWIQYAFGPTVSAWLGQHFYWHYRYSMDRTFLEEKAYPWISEVATYLEDVSVTDEDGRKKLPISSSPEIHNNSREAWYGQTTNFDLALIRWTYEKAAELALELGREEEANAWKEQLSQWPELAVDEETGLMIAPGVPLTESHRHLSHLMAWHPMGLIDWSKGEDHQEIIRHTLANLEAVGTKQWVGYSFSWLGNLQARAFDGEGAAETLRIFATSFCLPNSFHVNGDQSGKGYVNATYRPFTLEGNFAFAAGLQEMLIQSHTGVVHVFPAIPENWENVRFDRLRTQGAFLVSAEKADGAVTRVRIESTAGGVLRLRNPFGDDEFSCSVDFERDGENVLVIDTKVGDEIILEP